MGLVAGLAPDADVFITSATDPLLSLQFHRQFTHALAFIPVGALLVALFLHPLVGRNALRFRTTYLFCLAGYATHGLLDACTSYGTQLLWPFSDLRVAWNNISIIDPLFTVPILLLVILGTWRRSPVLARCALVWAVAYLMIGVVQRDRAAAIGHGVAATRGHVVERLSAKPTFANLLVWKIIYEAEGMFYVDAVRVGLGSRHYPGDAIAKLDTDRDLPWLQPNSQQARECGALPLVLRRLSGVVRQQYDHRYPLLRGAQRNRRPVGHYPQPPRRAIRTRALRRPSYRHRRQMAGVQRHAVSPMNGPPGNPETHN